MFYSQKNKEWANIKIARSNTTLGKSGCLITSCSNMDAILHNGIGRTPLQIMNIFITTAAIDNQGELTLSIGSKALNWKYTKTDKKPVNKIVIAETDCYISMGIPQHFFLINTANSKVIDPLDDEPKWKVKPAKYVIVSYRIVGY